MLLCITTAILVAACYRNSTDNAWAWTLDSRSAGILFKFFKTGLEWLSTLLGIIVLAIFIERATRLLIGYQRSRPDSRDLLIYVIAIITFSFTYYLWLTTVHSWVDVIK